jgi:hypothetical protein
MMGLILFVEILEIVSDALLMRPSSVSKLKVIVESLSNEEWFSELYEDSRYSTAIWNNKEIRKILLVPMNIEMIKNDAEKANQFKDLVKRSTDT